MLPRSLGSAAEGNRLSPDVHHGSRRRHKIGLADVVTLFFLGDDALNEFFQFVIAGPALHLGVQVVVPYGKETGADFAVAGDADAAAMSAEGMRHWRDDSDFADAVFETVAARRFRTRVRNLDQRA